MTEAEIRLHPFLTSALYGGQWSTSCQGALLSGKNPEPNEQEDVLGERIISYPCQDSNPGSSSVRATLSRAAAF
jgi:hypothetical protein